MSVQDGSGGASAQAAWESRMQHRSLQFDGMDLSGVSRAFQEEQPPGVHDIDYTRWSLAVVAAWLNSGRFSGPPRQTLAVYHQELLKNANRLMLEHQQKLRRLAQELEQLKQDTARRLREAQARRQRKANAREWTDQLLNSLLPLAQRAAQELRSNSPGDAPVLLGQGSGAPLPMPEQNVVTDMELDENDGANQQQQPLPPPAQPVAQGFMNIGWLHTENPPRIAGIDDGYLTFGMEGWTGIRVEASSGRYEYYEPQQNLWYPTDAFFLWCNLFTGEDPGPSPQFTCNNQPIEVDWAHLTQHAYRYMSDFSIKEVHTLWPPEMDSNTLAGHLQAAINHWAATSSTMYQVPMFGRARLVWADGQAGTRVKTFFPLEQRFQYSVEQMSDLADLIQFWS